ncbi:MAG: sulfotransferase family 2 domain-containing protein [Halocynthiibacter sp.]
MIISFRHKYIFVHAPKTGGTSLSLALEARLGKEDISIGDTPKAKKRKHRLKAMSARGRLWKHSTLRDIDGVVSEQQLSEMCVVTLVRNPWDRLVSYYHWAKEQEFDHPAIGLAKALSFPQFLQHPTIQTAFEAQPAASYVTDAAGNERCDHYVRLEHLAQDLKPFEAHLGFNLLPLAHENASQRRPDYQDYYSAADRDLVARFCHVDIDRFGYIF